VTWLRTSFCDALAITCYNICLLSMSAASAIANLSFAVPATAFSYVLETALAKYILKEHIGWRRWAGASLVGCGVLLVSLGV
jgi:drug/metabolite transporter (DMT)-like permease